MTEAMFGYPASHWLGPPEFFEEHMNPEDRGATVSLIS